MVKPLAATFISLSQITEAHAWATQRVNSRSCCCRFDVYVCVLIDLHLHTYQQQLKGIRNQKKKVVFEDRQNTKFRKQH